MPEYLTTRELADLLRIKERKVYDLAASGDVPCIKAMGKLLFSRDAIDAWLEQSRSGPVQSTRRALPTVMLGSHDPLLEWALRESRCGLATYFDGSLDGLHRFKGGEGVATGLHVFDTQSERWNIPLIRQQFPALPVVLIEWAKRSRGLIVHPDAAHTIGRLDDLRGRRITPRQAESGAQVLFDHLIREAEIAPDEIGINSPVRTEADAALSVLEGRADATFGLAAIAAQFRLAFVPLVTERFDLLVDRRAWFDPPMQTLLAFCRSSAYRQRAEDLAGYDISSFGTVHYNG